MIVLYAKPTQKSRCCDNYSAEIFTEYDRRLPLEWQDPLLGSVQVKRSIRKHGDGLFDFSNLAVSLFIFLYILPSVVRKNFCVISYENACSFFIALQMV